ncbi:MAG: hypothetical protein QG635_2369 [Bacteroidota bacterium]|nr:hypothetical protein [Bacteroidota bacterium]
MKVFLSLLLAVIIALMLFKLFLWMIGIAFAAALHIIMLLPIIILAIPLYFILRKKVFKR